jgi:2-phospho-L-lactate guanylyltransferase
VAESRCVIVWAIVPVKPFPHAKSRLASMLSPEERGILSRFLLKRTLDVLGAVAEIAGTVVVSSDADALALAEARGVVGLMEEGQGLNAALAQATAWVSARQGGVVLIVPADLPLLEPSDIQEILRPVDREPMVVIAPCWRGDGTNALLVRPLGLIEYRFGPGSFAEHSRQALRKGATLHIYRSPGLELDLDLPEDIRRWRQPLDAVCF